MTIHIDPAHVAADILCAALPGELDPELSDAYIYGPRGGVLGVGRHPEAGPGTQRPAIVRAIAWRPDRIHHGETLSWEPGRPGRRARYGSGYRLPAGPTTQAILSSWTPRTVRQVEAGQLSAAVDRLVDRLVEQLGAQDPVDRAAVAALRKLAAEYRRWERAGALTADDPATKPSRLAALVERHDLRWLRHPVLAALAANPATPAEALAALARDGSDEVRRYARRNPSTPAVVA